MIPSTPLFFPQDLTREIAELLPEYLPGVETGAAAITEGRGCWIKAWKALLTVLGRERGLDIVVEEERRLGAAPPVDAVLEARRRHYGRVPLGLG